LVSKDYAMDMTEAHLSHRITTADPKHPKHGMYLKEYEKRERQLAQKVKQCEEKKQRTIADWKNKSVARAVLRAACVYCSSAPRHFGQVTC
jgi:hypothetical protein